MSISRFAASAGVLLLGLGAGAVSAQDYPIKTVRIFAASAGSGGDALARLIASGISGPLGQPVIVENRAAIAGAETVSKAPPDGYTFLIQGGGLWTRPLLVKTSWDPLRDFTPVSRLINEVNILAVHPSLPVHSVKELIAYAKARPGQLNYASAVIGGSNHLATELFKSMAGIDIVHIPYKSGPSVMALASGDVQMVISDAGGLTPHLKSGKARALAVAGAEPSVVAPGLPTIAAAGLPGFDMVSTTGLFAPGKTPEKIVARISQEVRQVLIKPEVRERYLATGSEVVASGPEEFAAAIKSEIARMTKVIKDANITVE